MFDVLVGDGAGGFGLEGKKTAVMPLEDHIDFLAPVSGPEMTDVRFSRLGGNPDAKGGQGLEEVPQDSAVGRVERWNLAAQQLVRSDLREVRSETRICEVMFGPGV